MADSATSATSKRRSRGRSGGHKGAAVRRQAHGVIQQMPWQLPINQDRPTEPLSAEGIAAIHEGAMRILEEIGIEFYDADARAILRAAGCTVAGDNVRMGRDFVMEMVAKAPDWCSITPRNPERRIILGRDHMTFGSVSSPPNYWDLGQNRKLPGTRAAYRDFLKLAQSFNCIHFIGGYPVEPQDLHPSIRHLDAMYDKLTMVDKVVHTYCLGATRVEDTMEMVRIAAGLSHEEFEATPRLFANINSTSPLKHDTLMLDGWMRMAKRNQVLGVTPFTLAGAMAPTTLAGATALSIAEALCVIALAQYIRPGVPCVIGTFTSNVDMKSGAPAFGTPEYMRATQMTGQMARFYGLPLRSSGVCAANVPDGQAMWETLNSLWAAVQSGTHMVFHAAGWLEGGLIASPEKFVMDCEALQMIARYMQPETWETTGAHMALDAIAEVGSTGHFFGIQHTQDRYTTAFYQPFLSDWRNFESWSAAGEVWTAERAHQLYKEIVAAFKPPAFDAAHREALRAFVARRKQEGGAPTDF